MDNFKELFESRYTWIEGYMRNVRRYSRKLAIIDPESNKKWTYAEFNDDVNRLTNSLVSIGIGKKDVVMLDLLNCPEFAFAYVATQKIHAVCCPVSYRLSPGELADNIEDFEGVDINRDFKEYLTYTMDRENIEMRNGEN